MGKGQKILLLGVYGMEMVECGGVLCKNVKDGGISHTSILFAGPQMRPDLKKSAEILGCSLEFLNMDTGTVCASLEEKLRVIRVIRSFRPDIIITQDPEHCINDLDPGRRPAMILLLEAMSLAGRAYALDALPGLEPWRDFTVYYMTPENPNCLVEISDVWEEKCRAMDVLEAQLEFIGQLVREKKGRYEMMIPGFEKLSTDLEIGRAAKRLMDQAFHLYEGSTGHSNVFLSESYRRDGKFVLDSLMK